ncbi:MAG: DUF3108 domain-containing protein [Gemmatimonas sp.]
MRFSTFLRDLRLGVLSVAALAFLSMPLASDDVGAQSAVQSPSINSLAPLGAAVPKFDGQPLNIPFGVGERMDYDVRFLGGKKGEGSMEVREITDVRGKKAWHTVFAVKGRVVLLIGVNITLESWFDMATLNSLRFHQNQQYTGTSKIQTIQIYPERGIYKEDSLPERPTVKEPLDDGSFLYFVRSLPLEVGKTYSFDRYFKPDKNPIRITVLRREKVKVPAGEFNTIVLRPEIKSGGLFAEGKSQVWMTDDPSHMVVKLESEVAVGTLSLHLKRYKPGTLMKP